MSHGLTDPFTMLAFSSMPIDQLCEHHRRMLAALRDADHWYRLLTARIDLAVATVAHLDDLQLPSGSEVYAFTCLPPQDLRRLVGISGSDLQLHESTVLSRLRTAVTELDSYIESLRAVTGEAAVVIAERVGTVRVAV